MKSVYCLNRINDIYVSKEMSLFDTPMLQTQDGFNSGHPCTETSKRHINLTKNVATSIYQ